MRQLFDYRTYLSFDDGKTWEDTSIWFHWHYGVPTNTGNDVPACSEDGIIYTCCGSVVFFNDVELVNRANRERYG